MKKLVLIIFLSALFLSVNAQIFATTDNGRRVKLNMDNTWQYVDGGVTNPCMTKHTGNVTFKNNTSNDIYVYYSVTEYGSTQFTKIRPNSSKTINDLVISPTFKGQYYWVATNEMSASSSSLKKIQGISRGSFQLVECSGTEVEID